jgi:predicted DNA-binding WGR domain protein
MPEVIYACVEESSNKFWSYEVTGKSVKVKWGRIAGVCDEQVKTFSSDFDVNKFITTKVKEKERKNYKLVSKEKLKDEVETAKELGARNKIKKMLWVNRKGNELNQLDNYDPQQYVYVEVIDSYAKDKPVTRLLLSKASTWTIDNGITEMGRKIIANDIREINYTHTFAEAVRKILKKMASVVFEALKTIKFGAVGKRNLFDDDEQPITEVASVLASIDSAGFEMGVLQKFAAMGTRMLEL